MRASTLGCRFLDRCGCRLGVEISFKDMCILAAVLTVDAELSLGCVCPLQQACGVGGDNQLKCNVLRGKKA